MQGLVGRVAATHQTNDAERRPRQRSRRSAFSRIGGCEWMRKSAPHPPFGHPLPAMRGEGGMNTRYRARKERIVRCDTGLGELLGPRQLLEGNERLRFPSPRDAGRGRHEHAIRHAERTNRAMRHGRRGATRASGAESRRGRAPLTHPSGTLSLRCGEREAGTRDTARGKNESCDATPASGSHSGLGRFLKETSASAFPLPAMRGEGGMNTRYGARKERIVRCDTGLGELLGPRQLLEGNERLRFPSPRDAGRGCPKGG